MKLFNEYHPLEQIKRLAPAVRLRRARATTSCRYGGTIFELLIACLLSLLVGVALLSQMKDTYSSEDVIRGENSANVESRHSMDTLCDNLRNAQSFQIQAGPMINSALQSGSETDVTCYTSAAGATARYWFDATSNPPALKRTIGTTTTVLVSGLSSLSFTYYTTATFIAAQTSWHTTISPHTPTAAELPLVGAVGFSANVSIDGYSRPLSSFVRLRNSPR